jgi:hypothetical protein
MPTNTPVPPTLAPVQVTPTEMPLPSAATAVPPTAAPQGKTPWLDGRIHGNKLELRGGRFAAGHKVTVGVSKDKDASKVIVLGQANVGKEGAFNFSAKLPKQARDVRYVIVDDQGRRVIAMFNENKKD